MGQLLITPELPASLALAQVTHRWTSSYGRVSLDEQKTGKGVGSQHEENEDFGEEIGHPVERKYQDVGISAFQEKAWREGFQELLRDVRLGLIAIVIVWHADRLTRDVGEGREIIKLFRQYGVTLYSQQRGGSYNFERANGRADFLRDIVAAEEESGHKGERVSLSHKRRARNGEWGGGVRPFGWGVDTGRVRSYCTNPKADINERVYEDRPVLNMTQHNREEAQEIQHWKDELLAGVKVSHLIADINRRGVKTVSEKEGRKKMRDGRNILSYKWHRETVVGILTNPRTSGHAVWRGKVVAQDVYDAIITEEERQAIITLLSDPKRKTSTGNVPKWLGSLIYDCRTCGAEGGMRQRAKRVGGTPLYICSKCHKGRQNAVALDAYVEARVIARLSRPDIADLVAPVTSVDLTALKNERAALSQKNDTLVRMFNADKISEQQLETGTAENEQRLAEIQRELTQAVGKHPLSPFAANHERAETIWQTLSLGRRREIVRILMVVKVGKAPTRSPGIKIPGAVEVIDPTTIAIEPRLGLAV